MAFETISGRRLAVEIADDGQWATEQAWPLTKLLDSFL